MTSVTADTSLVSNPEQHRHNQTRLMTHSLHETSAVQTNVTVPSSCVSCKYCNHGAIVSSSSMKDNVLHY